MIITPPRSALYLPASNARAVEKARGLPADLTILDLEDAVQPELKAEARAAAVAAVVDFGKPVAIRINAADTPWHEADIAALAGSAALAIVVPKVEDAAALAALGARLNKPLIPMIETPLGVYEARAIAATQGVAGLFMGNNDLAVTLHVTAREGLLTALQLTVLAARAAGVWVLDGVYNKLEDLQGFAAECAHGRTLGFDGKTLIHPNQIAPCNAAFSPSEAELDEARALIAAAASGGAVRFRGQMVEAMHVEAARQLLARAEV